MGSAALGEGEDRHKPIRKEQADSHPMPKHLAVTDSAGQLLFTRPAAPWDARAPDSGDIHHTLSAFTVRARTAAGQHGAEAAAAARSGRRAKPALPGEGGAPA